MRTFTTSDLIFKRIRDLTGVDKVALQNFVDALNQNARANAVFTAVAERGDGVFELVGHDKLKENNAGALFSNDRGSPEFIERGNKFAIQLNRDWFSGRRWVCRRSRLHRSARRHRGARSQWR